MRFDYNKLLREQLYSLQSQLELSNFNFEVDSEQAFLKYEGNLEPNTIYVLTKDLQNDNSINVDTQPVQILILSEQNSLDIAKAFFSEFAKRYNFIATSQAYTENNTSHNIWIKQQYSDPVVLSNFNTVSFGYRSVLYIAATLYIMYDVLDVKNLKIDTESVEALNFNVVYSMNTNTQQLPNKYIATSLKTVSTFAVTLTVPMLNNNFVKKCLNILAETSGYDGNNEFAFAFDFGISTDANSFKVSLSKTMRLTSVQITTAPNSVPGLQLGFME